MARTFRDTYEALDYLVRQFLPDALDAAGLADHATALRGLAPIQDAATAAAAKGVADNARLAAHDALSASRLPDYGENYEQRSRYLGEVDVSADTAIRATDAVAAHTKWRKAVYDDTAGFLAGKPLNPLDIVRAGEDAYKIVARKRLETPMKAYTYAIETSDDGEIWMMDVGDATGQVTDGRPPRRNRRRAPRTAPRQPAQRPRRLPR